MSPPLSDAQIERYARQILLPEVGGRGQQLLLEATVEVRGFGDPSQLCAAWLAGAGVGCLVLPDEMDRSPEIVHPDLTRGRNPDTRLVRSSANVTLRISVGVAPRSERGTAVLWGTGVGNAVRWARLARGVVCGACVAPIAGEPAPGGQPRRIPVLTGAILAAEALRMLLGQTEGDEEAGLLTFSASSGMIERTPFPFCPDCSGEPILQEPVRVIRAE